MKYIILIPAFNAENTLPELLGQIRKSPVMPEKIVVIDDGSTDQTAEIAACDRHTAVKSLSVNRGKGEALKQGFKLISQQYDTDYILCMDADLQHPVSSLEDFLRRAESTDSKFIIGNRSKKPGLMPLHRVLSNTITSWLISGLCGQKIKDSQCGYRLIHRDVLDGMPLQENGFQLESEMIIHAARKGYQIGFVDIPTLYHKNSSNISNLKDTIRFIRLVLREFIRR